MAKTEGDFKAEFKKSLELTYPGIHIWTNTDMLRSGLPDFSLVWRGLFVSVEAKFVKKLPVRKDSKVLASHPVTPTQKSFLDEVVKNGQMGIVLIGTPNAAVVMRDIKENYTLEECLSAPRILKVSGKWEIGDILNVWRDEVFLRG